jgi:hypothetical protein
MFRNQQEYNYKMLIYFVNFYQLIHIFVHYEYYNQQISTIIFYSLHLFVIDKLYKIPITFLETIQIFLTFVMLVNDLKGIYSFMNDM